MRQQTEYVPVRMTLTLKAALQAAAGTPGAKGADGRVSALIKQFLTEKLIETGYLPPEGEQHAEEQKP